MQYDIVIQGDENLRVFINCPYDPGYIKLLHAAIFTVHDCGFEAVMALRKQGGGVDRLSKIMQMLSEAKYSIHDISFGESQNNLNDNQRNRLNMSFECGLTYGMNFASKAIHGPEKDLLVLCKFKGAESSILSDILGRDPAYHENCEDKIILEIRKFLASKINNDMIIRDHKKIMRRYEEFCNHLKIKCSKTNSKVSHDLICTFDYVPEWSKVAATWIGKNIRDKS